MRAFVRLGLLSLLPFGLACAGAPTPRADPHAATPRAKLVVVVVYDQVGSWVLEKHLPHLDPAGLVRTTMQRGTTHWQVRYAYAGTYTAPGHAAIFTGAPPSVSGIPANKLWDRARGRRVSTVDDAEHAVFGIDGVFAGPSILRVDTVGDVLRASSSNTAHVVAISMKDRSAVLPGGHHPDLALWFDARARAFTTSTYYAEALPPWLAQFATEHPTSALLTPWTPEDAAMLAQSLGPDDGLGEGDWEGFGRSFPHDVAAARDPYEVFTATPRAAEHLVAVAGAAVREYDLGGDATPDLLALSVSNTDIVGHTFGPDSWEALDNLVRSDRMLGAFVAQLRERFDVAVLITADHGVSPTVEHAAQDGHAGGVRIVPSDVKAALDAATAARLGPGAWIEAFSQPFVYLPAAVRDGADRARVMPVVLETLRALPGVHAAYDARDAERLRGSADPVEHAVGLSIDPDSRGDVFVVPGPYSVMDEEVPRGAGTSHGSPWDYDTTVAVLFDGPGVAHGETREVLPQSRVAPTIAALLGISEAFSAQCAREQRERMDALPGAP